MRTFVLRTSIPASVEEVYRWHAQEDSLTKLTPGWMPVRVVKSDAGLIDGNEVVLRLGTSFAGMDWVARIMNVRENAGFEDTQVSGPFKYWHHTHSFIPSTDGRTILEDKVEYSLPFGADALIGWLMDVQLDLLFRYRHATTKNALDSGK
jgi:ligand-binding SRPBCC domain-containing protein